MLITASGEHFDENGGLFLARGPENSTRPQEKESDAFKVSAVSLRLWLVRRHGPFGVISPPQKAWQRSEDRWATPRCCILPAR